MPASFWGLLAKVGPYKLTKTDEKHLHERGNNKHYISAFTRMRPSSLGSETLPKGIQSQEAWLPKIHMGMVESPKFQNGITGRNQSNRPAQTTDRDRAIFNTMENQNYTDRNISNLNQEQQPESFTGPLSRPRVAPLKIENSNFESPASMIGSTPQSEYLSASSHRSIYTDPMESPESNADRYANIGRPSLATPTSVTSVSQHYAHVGRPSLRTPKTRHKPPRVNSGGEIPHYYKRPTTGYNAKGRPSNRRTIEDDVKKYRK
jgi:hypothetical protein